MVAGQYAADYFNRLKACLDRVDAAALQQALHALERARENGRAVFVFGNGGSAATASHLVNDLNKLASTGLPNKFRCLALNDNVPLMTAWGNDSSYNDIFCSQLENFVEARDVVLAISASGNSENIIRALQLARARKATTVSMLGFDVGRAVELSDVMLLCPVRDYGIAESAHSALCHVIANYLSAEETAKRAHASANAMAAATS